MFIPVPPQETMPDAGFHHVFYFTYNFRIFEERLENDFAIWFISTSRFLLP
jgi:hypothetical protein